MKRFTEKKGRRGFSLVEIMVVVAVMALLTVAVGNIMGGSSDRAAYVRAEKDLESIYQAFINIYNVENGFGANIAAGTFPPSDSGVRDRLQKFLNKPIDEIEDPWGLPYRIANVSGSTGWNESEKTGGFYVYCSAKNAATEVRLNPHNKNKQMMRYIINQ